MALPETDAEWVARLSQIHDSQLPRLKALNDEYELLSPRSYMHPEILKEIGDRLEQVVIAWPQLVVDSVEERLDVEGFRLPDQAEADDDLWRVWQENNADETSQQGRVDALVMGRSYMCVGANEADPDTPLITFESPLEMYADIDPR
ncbi:MAG: phage portal protein, partial [Micromonosporaceae bacterium]